MWNPYFLGLIFFSTGLDYLAAKYMRRQPQHKLRALWVSLVANLGLLAYFKYSGFFIESVGAVAIWAGFDLDVSPFKVLLPVGISFYTFQTLSYTIDVYRNEIEPEDSLLDFALFVTFFPQLVAGPIVRAREFLPQLKNLARSPRPGSLTYIVWGLFLKAVVADGVAPRVQKLFDFWQTNNALQNWSATTLFGVQIYGDFAGYSLMAIGIAGFLGFELPRNFHSPYGALGFSDFWQRWHISLSTWLRDYLYISLGGNRLGSVRTYFNLMATMLLGGLWHGASVMFIIWGALHGFYLVIERALKGSLPQMDSTALRVLGLVATYLTVSVTWIPFRAADIKQCLGMLGGLFWGDWALYNDWFTDLSIVVAVWGAHIICAHRNPEKWIESTQAKTVFFLFCLFGLYFYSGESSGFIYFQF